MTSHKVSPTACCRVSRTFERRPSACGSDGKHNETIIVWGTIHRVPTSQDALPGDGGRDKEMIVLATFMRDKNIEKPPVPCQDRLLCRCGAVAKRYVPERGWCCVECWCAWVEREQQRNER